MNDYSGRENLSQCVRSLFGCCLGKCCDSTAAAPGFLQSCEKMKINSLGLILIENQCQLFLIVKLRKGLFQLLFVFCFTLMLEQFPNITIQELTHSILILPRQTQLEFTLSLFLRLNYHQTYQLKTCWYSEKCNGRLLYNLDEDKNFCLRKCSN